jgi:hypothetical protein
MEGTHVDYLSPFKYKNNFYSVRLRKLSLSKCLNWGMVQNHTNDYLLND